jgi:hypothetical protein
VTIGDGKATGGAETEGEAVADRAEPGAETEGEAVADRAEPGAETEGEAVAAPEAHPADRTWRNRKSIRALRREMASDIGWNQFDERKNQESRLPPDEDVRLGGVVLVEAFTPSTASSLRRAIEQFPSNNDRRVEWQARFDKGRSAAGSGGWNSLGVIRRPGAFGFNGFDPDMPDMVEAISPTIFWVTPSLTVVVATFTLKENAGDLSEILRADYATSPEKAVINVSGRFSGVRTHIPWARPKGWSASQDIHDAEQKKVEACEAAISRHERACVEWFGKRFPGVFHLTGPENRPRARLLFTKKEVPFDDYQGQFYAVNLAPPLDAWTSTSQPGWKLSFHQHRASRPEVITFAARRSDAARSPGGSEPGDSIWYLTQFFARNQSSLVARWGIARLLALYANRLAALRDRSGRPKIIRRPVREAREFDKFLMRDGLDAATVISDLEVLTRDLSQFRFDVADYSEDMSLYPPHMRTRSPAELVTNLYHNIKGQAERLKSDTEAATSNISSSAQLRQAIANTRLQRTVIVLTIIAIAIAVISLYVSTHPNNFGSSKTTPTPAAKLPSPGKHLKSAS